MNKQSRSILAAAAAVLIIIAVILAVKVRGSSPDPSGLIIQNRAGTVTVSWEDLKKTEFTGEIVNGKGEISNHEYQGAELYELISGLGIVIREDTKITAVSEDNYAAELTGAEIMTAGKVYAAVICDGGMVEGIDGGQGAQLVVYGDSSAKRQVRYLKTITVEDPAGE